MSDFGIIQGKNGKSIRVIEIVGPAGAGKSTLCNVLVQQSQSIQLGRFPDVWKFSEAPFFFWNGLRIALSLLGMPKNGSRQLTRREFAWMAILKGWPSRLQRTLKADKDIIVIDQGPIYLISELQQTGPAYFKGLVAEKMWETLYLPWTSVLDAIVWLDARDNVLLKRIQARDSYHVMKNKPDDQILQFLSDFRSTYGNVINRMIGDSNNIKVIRFDTEQKKTTEIASDLMKILNLQEDIQ